MKFSSSAGPHRISRLAVPGEEGFRNATTAGEALAELGAEQKKNAIAVTKATRKTALGRTGMRPDQVEYGRKNVTTKKRFLSAPT
jgi:hypothetical protein